MPNDCISYQDSGYFSSMVVDYLNQKPELQSFYNRFPSIENFKKQIEQKQDTYNHHHREVLAGVLKKQYESIPASNSTSKNITALADSKTYTVTTGHQLNLFTGPLYFLYKIISTINLTHELRANYPEYTFVPIYWMATEDHDFEEINYFNFHGRKIRWNTESSGPVGRLSTAGIDAVYEVFEKELGIGTQAKKIKSLFKEAYLKHQNLSDATRFLANALFGETGLVILDADDIDLKRLFIPFVKEELLQQTSYTEVTKTIELLSQHYEIQVNPREINLFYIEDRLRERIVFENGNYKIKGTSRDFTESEILHELEKHPEKFSPNVILRPLFQEVILPNLCYIGGGGELAYWFELKSYFDAVAVPFPIVLLRNSALLVTEKQQQKTIKLGLNWNDLFMKELELITHKTRALSKFPVDLMREKEILKKQFDYLYTLANQTDPSFSGAVKAQEAKQIGGIEHLEKRLLKAQKRKYKETLDRIISLQNELFPNGSLQERQANFSTFYVAFGKDFIDKLFVNLKPLEQQFTILVL